MRWWIPWIVVVGLGLPSPARAEFCGDGVLDPGEACDLGLGNDGGGACTPACTAATCGDGVQSLDESCDDGNIIDADGCSATCRDEQAPLVSETFDGRALQDEWFVDLERVSGTTFVLHHGADAWQQWASLIAAYDAEGQRWSVFSGGPDSGRFDALTVTGDRVIAVGRRGVVPQWQGALASYTHAGQAVGESLFPQTEHLTAVAVAANGDLFLGGTTVNDDADRWLGRYALATDTLVWSRDFPRMGGTESVAALVSRDGAGLYATGIVGNDAFVLRLDPGSGEPLWDVRPIPGGSTFRAESLDLVVMEDRLVLAGRAFRAVDTVYGWDTDGWVASFTHDGALQWEAFDAGSLPTGDGFFALTATDGGAVVAAGYRHRQALATFVDWDVDAVLVEFDAQGGRGRELVFDGPTHLSDSFSDLAWLGEDRFVVAGQSHASMEAEVGLVAEFTLPAIAPPKASSPPTRAPVHLPPARGAAAPHTQTLYVNFGGGSLRPGDDGRLGQLPCIDAGFDFPGSEAHHVFVGAVMERVRMLLEPFDVRVVWEARPPAALPYTTVLVGGHAAQIGVDAAAGGFACAIDCGNLVDNELVFAFEDGTPETLANTIVHEAGHAWGLDHVIEQDAVMSPFASGTEAALVDGCIDISAETTRPTCMDAHAEFCPSGQQDAHAELLARFGERRPDLLPPRIEGVPEAAVEVEPGEPIAFSLSVEDDSANPGVALRVDALGIRKTLDPGALEFDVYLPHGEHIVDLEAVDHAGNVTTESVAVRVAPAEAEGGSSSGGGDEDTDIPETTATDSADPDQGGASASGCGCNTYTGPGAADLLGVLLVGLAAWPRRRSRSRSDHVPVSHPRIQR